MMSQHPGVAPSPAVRVDLSSLHSLPGSASEKLLDVTVSVGLLVGKIPQPPSGESLLSVLVSHWLSVSLAWFFMQ